MVEAIQTEVSDDKQRREARERGGCADWHVDRRDQPGRPLVHVGYLDVVQSRNRSAKLRQCRRQLLVRLLRLRETSAVGAGWRAAQRAGVELPLDTGALTETLFESAGRPQ